MLDSGELASLRREFDERNLVLGADWLINTVDRLLRHAEELDAQPSALVCAYCPMPFAEGDRVLTLPPVILTHGSSRLEIGHGRAGRQAHAACAAERLVKLEAVVREADVVREFGR